MPLGTRHIIHGVIERGAWGFILRPDDGGVWELEHGFCMGFRLRATCSQPAWVEGERVGFNALFVRRLELGS